MKVLLVLEDPTHDQYIVKPIIEKLFEDLSRKAKVFVLKDPRFRGVDDALDPQTLADVVEDNPMIDLFLLVVDRDCNRTNNEERLAIREQELEGKLLGCLAREEVECWMLAAQNPLPGRWRDIQADCDPKERYAAPWLKARGWATDVGGGRKRAMSGSGWFRRVLSRCGEVQELRNRIEAHPAVRRA